MRVYALRRRGSLLPVIVHIVALGLPPGVLLGIVLLPGSGVIPSLRRGRGFPRPLITMPHRTGANAGVVGRRYCLGVASRR